MYSLFLFAVKVFLFFLKSYVAVVMKSSFRELQVHGERSLHRACVKTCLINETLQLQSSFAHPGQSGHTPIYLITIFHFSPNMLSFTKVVEADAASSLTKSILLLLTF